MVSRLSRFGLLFAFGLAALWWAGCASKSVSDDAVVATWGDTTVTVANFKDRMYIRFRNEPSAMKQPLEERYNILEEYIDRDLKLAEARRLGYDKREDINKQYNDAMERKATELLYNAMVRDRFFTDEMVKEYWDHDREEIRCRHILISVPDNAGKDTMTFFNRINQVNEEAKSGEDFEKLVDKYSEDSTIDRSAHGDLGFFRWGKMVDSFQEAAWELKPGEISKPVRTKYGWHVIQLVERRSRGLEFNTSHILIKCTRRADPAESTAAFERATMVFNEAKKKGADFAQLARRFSEDDNTWVNGEVGYIPRGSMPSEYWEALFDKKDGEIVGPVRTYKGYHVIKLHERQDNQAKIDDKDERERVLSAMSRIYREPLKAMADAYLDSVKRVFEMKYVPETEKLLLKKLNDKNAPTNMNRFNSFTAEERELLLVSDKLGGLKIDDLAQMFGENAFPPQYRDEHAFIEEMVDQILIPKYLTVFAKDQGYMNKPEVLEEGKRALDNAMLPEIERETIYDKAAPNDAEIHEYYKKNLDKYTIPPKASVIEILVSDKQFAKDLLERINKGEKIEKLARQYTQRPQGKHTGGKMGGFVRDKYGAMSEKAFQMKEGGMSGVIDNGGGMYSIIKMLGKTEQVVQSLDSSRSQIESDLRFESQKNMKEQWIQELRKKYNLVINKDVIKSVWPVVDQLPEPMVAERKQWQEGRKSSGERASAKRKSDSEIKMKLKPGSTQTFRRDGKDIQVKIGEPRYVKDGKPIDPSKSNVKLTPKGKLETKDGSQPSIKLKPKEDTGKK